MNPAARYVFCCKQLTLQQCHRCRFSTGTDLLQSRILSPTCGAVTITYSINPLNIPIKMSKNNPNNAGRHPKLDPIAFRCSVNFNAMEQVQLEAMHQKSGVESMSAFIKLLIFGKPFKVFYVDQNSRIFIDKLSDLNAQYRTIGVAYDQAVKALREHFTEKRANAMVKELVSFTKNLVGVSHKIVELAEKFDSEWLQKYR